MSNNDKKEKFDKTKEIFLDFTMSEEDNLDQLLNELIGGKKEEKEPAVSVETVEVLETQKAPILEQEPLLGETTEVKQPVVEAHQFSSGNTLEVDLSEIEPENEVKPKVHFIDESIFADSTEEGEDALLKDIQPLTENESLFSSSLFSNAEEKSDEVAKTVEPIVESQEKLHQTGGFIFDGLSVEELLTPFKEEEKQGTENSILGDTILSKEAIQEIKEEFNPLIQKKEPELVLNEKAKSKIGDTIEVLLSDITTENNFLQNDGEKDEPFFANDPLPFTMPTVEPEIFAPEIAEQVVVDSIIEEPVTLSPAVEEPPVFTPEVEEENVVEGEVETIRESKLINEEEKTPKSSLDILLEKLNSISAIEPLPIVKEHSVAADEVIGMDSIIPIMASEPEKVIATETATNKEIVEIPTAESEIESSEIEAQPEQEQVLPKEERIVPKSGILFEPLKAEPKGLNPEDAEGKKAEEQSAKLAEATPFIEKEAEQPVKSDVNISEQPKENLAEYEVPEEVEQTMINGLIIPQIAYKKQEEVDTNLELSTSEDAGLGIPSILEEKIPPQEILEPIAKETELSFVSLEDSFDFENELLEKSNLEIEPTLDSDVQEAKAEGIIPQPFQDNTEQESMLEKTLETPLVETDVKEPFNGDGKHPDHEPTKEFALDTLAKTPETIGLTPTEIDEKAKRSPENESKVEEGEPILTKSFLIRAVIALSLYASLFFINITAAYIWGPIIRSIISLPFIVSWIKQLGGSNQELLQAYQSIFVENILYFILFIIIVPLFWRELKESAKKLKQNLLYLLVLPVAYGVGLFLTGALQAITLLFVEQLPSSSQNQDLIVNSISVSKVGNIFPTIIGAPFVEEIIFRTVIAGGIYGLILLTMGIKKENQTNSNVKKNIAAVVSILVSTTLFGLLHVSAAGDYLAILPYIAMGMTFTTVYFITKRNLLVTILLHMLINLVSFIQIIS